MVPVIAILICGVVDLGRAYHLKNQLKNAAREGAIYGQTHPLAQQTPPASTNPAVPCANQQSIQARALGELQQSGQLKPQNLTIVISPSTTCGVALADGADADAIPDLGSGEELVVTARSSFKLFTPIVSAMLGSPITVTESVTVEIQ
jgi:Flp pilus assembly protein TadG